jgi:hypothetical protein
VIKSAVLDILTRPHSNNLAILDSSVVEPKLFCFRSGSGTDFQKVLAPAPTLAFYLPFITDFILKSGFFMFFL